MKVMVLGGDGFCGWPTVLRLSQAGFDVAIVDNLSRRKIDLDLEADSLTPIAAPHKRISVWKEKTGKDIQFHNIDIARDYYRLAKLIEDFKPKAIVHFAEQRSAPYSMKNEVTRRYTVDNNLTATHNVLSAITDVDRDIHLIHLGTMGVYGYNTTGMILPEGYQRITMTGPKANDAEGEMVNADMDVIYPPDPGSVYHLTKSQDALFFYFFNKNYGLRVTDLHQGIVWGTQTEETSIDEALVNRFDYDGDYGTVLNRFLMQAALGYPMTVYGTGGQTRAFIHIRDTVRCIQLAIENPPAPGDRVTIRNQVTETHRLIDLANMISEKTGGKIEFLENPRKEKAENELFVENKSFIGLGLEPTKLSEGFLEEVSEVTRKYADNCNRSKIAPSSFWK